MTSFTLNRVNNVMSSAEFEKIFARLRSILSKQALLWSVTEDSPGRYCLEGRTGAATLKSWGGKMKRPTIPVAWVQIGRAYVSFHLMGLYGDSESDGGLSKELKARMQGKTCFNFRVANEALFKELEGLTDHACNRFRKAGFVE